MNAPSFDQAKGIAVLVAVGLVGFVLWKVWKTAGSAATAVSETLGNVGDAIGGAVDSAKAQIGGMQAQVAGAARRAVYGDVGPSAGESRQVLQTMPAQPDPAMIYEIDYGTMSPESMSFGADSREYTSVDVYAAGSPDALPLS